MESRPGRAGGSNGRTECVVLSALFLINRPDRATLASGTMRGAFCLRRCRLTTSLDCIASVGSTGVRTKRPSRPRLVPNKSRRTGANGLVTDDLSTIYIEQTIIQVRSATLDPDFSETRPVLMPLFITSHQQQLAVILFQNDNASICADLFCFWLLSLAVYATRHAGPKLQDQTH